MCKYSLGIHTYSSNSIEIDKNGAIEHDNDSITWKIITIAIIITTNNCEIDIENNIPEMF